MGIFGNASQHCRNLTLIAFLEINALTLCIANGHTQKPLFVMIFLTMLLNICWIFLFVFDGSAYNLFSLGGSLCPPPHKDETWGKNNIVFPTSESRDSLLMNRQMPEMLARI